MLGPFCPLTKYFRTLTRDFKAVLFSLPLISNDRWNDESTGIQSSQSFKNLTNGAVSFVISPFLVHVVNASAPGHLGQVKINVLRRTMDRPQAGDRRPSNDLTVPVY